MPTSDYRLKNGKPVPGTTTIINRFKDAGGIIYWAWKQGKEGKDFRETKQDAADAGTLAHALVFAHLKGEPLETILKDGIASEIKDKATMGFQNYLHFEKTTKLKIIALETPMVSELYAYGGTPDALMEIDGQLALGDWKTSDRVYTDYLLQLAAYGSLWEENHPESPLTGGFHLCRFSKEYGDFSHHYYSELKDVRQMFLCLRTAYELDKTLKKRV